MDRPRPAPPPSFSARERALSARKKRSKMRGCKSLGTPPPVSVMLKEYSSPERRQVTAMRPPSGVYLMALSSRLRIMRRSRDSSAWMGDSQASSKFREIFFEEACESPIHRSEEHT